MPEALANHEIESVGRAGVGPGAQRVLGHDIGDGNIVRLETGTHNAEGEILGGENASNSFIIVGNQHAVLTLRGHELGGLGDGRRGLDLKGSAGLKGEDGSRRGLAGVSGPARQVLLLGEIVLHLAADGLITATSKFPIPIPIIITGRSIAVWLEELDAVIKLTSSRFVCFCLLALSEEAPASLAAVLAVSSTGRGMAEPAPAAGLVNGMAPRL